MKTIVALCFLLLSASLLYAEDKPATRMDNYIAVFDLDTVDVDKKISHPLTESIRRELVLSGKYEVIDRGNMNKILGEQKFQMSGCVSGQCIVEAGQLLGVGKIVAGSVSMIGKTYYLSLSLINVKTGKIENISEDKCECRVEDLIDSSKRLARKLLGGKAEEASQQVVTDAGGQKKEHLPDGVIDDPAAELQWAKGPDRNTTWDEAKSYAENLSIAGGGWRLPTRAELKSLYIRMGSFGGKERLIGSGWWVWSSELYSSSNGWGVSFYSGVEDTNDRFFSPYSGGCRVLVVRSRR